jgi:hypothetical protein
MPPCTGARTPDYACPRIRIDFTALASDTRLSKHREGGDTVGLASRRRRYQTMRCALKRGNVERACDHSGAKRGRQVRARCLRLGNSSPGAGIRGLITTPHGGP